MGLDKTNEVDFIGVNEATVNMVLFDDRQWGQDDEEHMYDLQEKINSYLRFCEAGELEENFPNSKGKEIEIEVVSEFPKNKKAEWFFEKVAGIIEDAGFKLVLNHEQKN